MQTLIGKRNGFDNEAALARPTIEAPTLSEIFTSRGEAGCP
jgi:hypothetical protein